jgi:Zn-dependent M28 family amino/carboxypeptidase
LKAAGDSGTYFQSFNLASVTPHAPTGRGRNVVALLTGSDPQLKNEYIVVGAHYDHLGMGLFGSTSGDANPAIHNGADDNASGVAVLLDVAERLKKSSRPARTIVFIAFTGEEEGILGSTYYSTHSTGPIAQTKAMLNMDMVGRLSQGPLIIYGIGTATEWKQLVTENAKHDSIEIALFDDGYGASDHTAFYLKDCTGAALLHQCAR